MTTTPVLIPIPNLGAGTDPPNPAADLVAVSQSGVARKLTINELLDGAHPVNWTVDYLTVIHDATVGGTLGVTGTGTFAGSLIAGNAGTAPITLQSGIISMPASQSLQIRLATAGQTVGIGAPAPGLGQALTITPNTNGNNAFGALPNDVAVNNRLTFTSARTIGGTYALSGTVTPTAITGNGATITITFPIISGIVLTVGSSVTLSGVTPSGYNGTRTILTASNTQVTLSGSTTGTVTVLGSMTYNLLSPQVLNVSSNWSGTPIAGVRFAPYRFLISSDTTATDGTGQGAAAMEIAHNWLGAATGGKLGMQVSLSHTGATNDTGSQQHVVANLHGQSFFNAGGTGTGSLAHGTFYGLNPQIRLNSGATYWNLVNVLGEVDLAVNASQQNINLGGTVTAGNVVTLTFASADIVGSPVAVSWTLGAGQTLPMVANNLAAAVNANAALRNAKIGATGWEGALRIYYYTHISTLTITPSVSGGATITAALGTFTSGASTSFKTMASFIRLADDDAPGSSGSALMIFGTQYSPSPSGQFEAGIAFNGQPAYHGSWSFTQNATLIGSNLTTGVGNLDKSSPILSNTAGFGVDWQLVNFTRATNGRAFRSSNFGVGGEGNIYSGGAVIAPTSAGLSIDVTGRTASSVALAAGGGGGSGQVIGNYFIGDIGFDDYNGQYRVTGVNAGTGAVTTFAVESPPSYSSGSAPANPITVNGGSGRNWTVNATWPSAASLSFQASGGNSLFGGTITIGNTTPLVGGSKFFRFGYGATNPLVVMQSAGTDSTGAAQQVLSISQQVTHTGAGGAGAIGALYSASTIDGAPYQDYYAAAFTMTNRALRLGGATPDQAQHGTLFTHQVKALPTAGFNPGDVMADSWVQWWVMQDRTNLPSSQGGALVGVEFDIFGNNQDDAPTKKRFARQVVLNNYASDAAHPLEWGYGDYWNSFTGGAQDTFFNVVSAYYAGWTVAAIDLSQGTGSRANPYVDATNRGVDIKMRDGGKLGFNGDGATGSYMTHGTSRFQYWAGGSERASISDTGVGIIGGGTAPFTLSNGTLSVPSSQNMAIQLASAGTSISLGATSAGLGNVLTITPNSNGNSFFGSVPNDVTIPNRLTVGQLRSSGGTFALSGTVTPTAFSGTGATATVTFAAISGVVIPVGSSVTISGATPAGYNGTYTVTASTNTTVSFASSTTGALSVAGSMAYAMQSQRIVNMTSSWSGTPAAGTAFFPYTFTITSDTADTQGTNSGAPIMYLAHNWGGAAKGSKGGLRIGLIQTSATNDPPVGLVNQQHVVGEWWGATGYNTGGTGSGTLAAGSFYGTNPQILLQPGATYWRLANAMGEVNLAVYASSRTLTVGGTVTAGDVLTVTFASADIVGTPVSVSWTVGASQTTGMIANNIAAAIWSNAALSNAKISASVSGSVVTIYWFTHIAALTTTVSTSGGATETLTLGSPVGGASADIKLMGSLVRLADDTAPATKNSAFFLFTSQPGGGTAGLFDYGLVFGTTPNYGGEWSWHKGSTLIEAGVATTYGGSGQTHPIIPNWAKYGLDFSKVGFSGNGGASIRVPGFQIASDTTGAVFIGGYKIAATSAGLLFDTTTGGTASAVALNSGGGGGAGVATGNYVVGDLGHDAYGGQYEVATVNASTGAVATFTVRVYPSFTSGAAPANPIAVTGGSGSGWTVNATWPSAPRVQFQASGGNTLVGTGSAIATNATSGFLQLPTMAGAPTGVVGAAGQAAVVIDTTNNKICWSTGGGTWKCALGS